MSPKKAYAKVNIFLKITGKQGEYHTIASRFMLVKELYDELEFFPKKGDAFVIEGEFGCQTKQNTIYKAYKALLEYTKNEEIEKFFRSYGVRVHKRIPAFAGLGGGSSDAATFLKMVNSELALGMEIEKLAFIGAKVGADLPFFVYGYESANVTGVGEIVEEFEEKPLQLKIITPKVAISTPMVYKKYREEFYNPLSQKDAKEWLSMPSLKIFQTFSKEEANDLYLPALALYPELQSVAKKHYFFSGSGSSFFYLLV